MFSPGTAGAHHSLGTPTNTNPSCCFPCSLFHIHTQKHLSSNARKYLCFGTEQRDSTGWERPEQRLSSTAARSTELLCERARGPVSLRKVGKHRERETGTGWFQGKWNDALEIHQAPQLGTGPAGCAAWETRLL